MTHSSASIALSVIAGTLLAVAAYPARAADSVALVHQAKALMPILVGSDTEPAVRLQAGIKKITGAELTIEPAQRGRNGLYVGRIEEFPWLELPGAESLAAESFLLKSEADNVYVIGKDVQGVGHGVEALLDEMGCRWFFPGPVWEVIPRTATLSVRVDQCQAPAFDLRRIWHGFGSFPRVGQQYDDWCRHNRLGGTTESAIGHTWVGLDPERDFAQHPEWFALVGGQRQPSKPCYSHPEVIAKGIEYAIGAAKKSDGRGMVSLSPPDGLGYCECPRCFAVFHGGKPEKLYDAWFATRPDGTFVNATSETLFAFANKVAESVAAQFPRMQFGLYAYSAYSHPPSFKLHPNVLIQTTTAYRRTPLSLEEQFDRWRNVASRLSVRDYFSVYQWDWDMPDPGKMAPANIKKHLQHLYAFGVRGVNAEASNNFGPRGVGYYMAARLLWDIDAGVEDLLDDFYVKAFGPAAPPMKRYYQRQFGLAEVEKDPVDELGQKEGKKLGMTDFVKHSYRDLDAALAAVNDRPAYLARVDDIRRYLHWVYLKTKLEAAGKDRDLALKAIEDVTVMGGRLTDTHMIHSRPLIGKAWERTFRSYQAILPGEEINKSWRVVGEPPSHEELNRLWAQDKREMGL